MTPEALTALVTAVFAGLTALLAALGGLAANRARRTGVDRRELRTAQRYGLDADRWIFTLERELARRGVALPDGKPKSLTVDDDDADDPPPARAVARG